MKILITSFEPFGNITSNSSFEIVKLIEIPGIEIVKENLPVIYNKEIYMDLLTKHKADYILLCGQAAGRAYVNIEQIAINFLYSDASDNNGTIKKGEKIFDDGPDAIFSNIRTLEIVENLKSEFPVRLSLSAGGYICNLSLYSTLYYINKLKINTKVGFIHFPLYEGQITDNKYPTLKIEDMVDVLYRIIKELI